MVVGSRNDAKPSMSRRTGRISVLRPGRGQLVVDPVEQRLHPRVGDVLGTAELGEQLARGAAELTRTAGSGAGRDECLVDAYLQGVRQLVGDLLAESGSGRLAHVDPQVVVAEIVALSKNFGHGASNGAQPTAGSDRDVGDHGR